MIKAVFFDIGSTLVAPKPDIDGVFHEIANKRGHDISFDKVSRHLPAVYQLYDDRYRISGDFWCSQEGAVEIFHSMYQHLSCLTGLHVDAQGIAEAVYDAYLLPGYWNVYEDTWNCLNALQSAGLRLGVVSNWAATLKGLLEGLKVKPYFEEVFASAEVGYRKPNPQIFEVALESMGLNPEEVMHVGDKPDADGVGAHEAGLLPVIIDRHNQHGDCGFTRIRSLDELPPFISRLT